MQQHRSNPLPPWHLGPHCWDFSRPLVMGVLNATPDSFSDGGEYMRPEAAVLRAREMAAEGADLIDVGGASSHPRARPVAERVELARVLPVVERLLAAVDLPISIDTQRPRVAQACLRWGVHLINDVSGLTDPAMARVAAEHGVPLVVMYNNFALPRRAPRCAIMPDLLDFFAERIAACEAAGARRVILDPGYGFGKTLAENVAVLRGVGELRRFARPVLVCTSRKGSLGVLGREPVPQDRLGASVASSLFAIRQGAHMVRVHDVKAYVQAQRTWLALSTAGNGA